MSREAQRRYQLKHHSQYLANLKKWRAKNPKKSLIYRKTFKGYFTEVYCRMRRRIQGGDERYLGLDLMDLSDWKEFIEDTIEDRKVLWDEWVASGHKLRFAPSIDRINSVYGYIRSNCRWLPQWENSRNGGMSPKMSHLAAGK